MSGYNQELDLHMLQLLTAAFGAEFVTAQIFSRFTWGAPDTKVSPIGHWHFLRLCLSIATDTSKSDHTDPLACRIVHALARKPLKRSDVDRLATSYEMDDDKKQLALDAAIEKTLKAVAVASKMKDGNVIRLKPDAWKQVNCYHGSWTPYDAENAAENFVSQNKQHYTKDGGKVPFLPTVSVPTKHNPLLARVVEVLHTQSVLAVAIGTLATRAKDLFKGKAVPTASKSQVITAIDTLYLALSSAKSLAVGAADWKAEYEIQIGRLRRTAIYGMSTDSSCATLLKNLPIQLAAAEGMIHKAMQCSVSHVSVQGAQFVLPSKPTVHEVLKFVISNSESLLEDVSTHHVLMLKGVVAELDPEASVIVASTTDVVDPEVAAAAEAQKKAALKQRQELLMAKLRQKNSNSSLVSTANSLRVTGVDNGNVEATDDTTESTSDLNLTDCITVYETLENRCVFCSEPWTAQRPLLHMCQRATSDVLQQLYALNVPAELVTGHVNFCGHMAHAECFQKRVKHTGGLRQRGSGISQIQAYLQGLHFKGLRYLTDQEVVCPLCSRAISLLCPAVTSAAISHADATTANNTFINHISAAVMRCNVGSGRSAASVEALLAVLHTPGSEAPLADAVTAWGAVRVAAQQLCITGILSSVGRTTTARHFAGLAALIESVKTYIRGLPDLSLSHLIRLLQAEYAIAREPHCLLEAMIATVAVPGSNELAQHLASIQSHVINIRDVASLLEHRAVLRGAAFVEMAIHRVPLPSQRKKLRSAASADDVANALEFRDVDPVAVDGGPQTEINLLLGLARYVTHTDDASELPCSDAPAVSVDVVTQYRAALRATFTRNLVSRYSEMQHIFSATPIECSMCGSKTPNLVKCLSCASLLCVRGEPPELKEHAKCCGGGTQLFLELQTSRIVVVQGYNQRASTLSPLYVDKNGETDPGLRRGCPLTLDDERAFEVFITWVSCAWDHLTSILHQDTWLIDTKAI